MKELPIRKFTTVVGYLTEAVTITKDGQPIGTFTPTAARMVSPAIFKEASVDESVRKSLEVDKARPDSKGQLRKGLGPLPGEENRPDAFKAVRPVPKPGTKK